MSELSEILERIRNETPMLGKDMRGLIADGINLVASSTLSGTVYAETSSSQATRTITIPDITSWDDVLGVPLFIRATAFGTTTTTTLNINGLGAKTIYFPSGTNSDVVTTPSSNLWVRLGQVYCVVWTGTYLVILNPQVKDATTAEKGVVQLTNSVASTSTTTAATPNSVKQAYDEAADAADTANETAELITGKAITLGDDLNDYTEPGNYFCSTTAICSTLANCPVTSRVFSLEVLTSSTSDNRRIQRLTAHYTTNEASYGEGKPVTWVRSKYADSAWSEWVEVGAGGSGSGDMLASVYDPNGKAQDIFAYADDKVNISGDTMTGKLTISSGGLVVGTLKSGTTLGTNALVQGGTNEASGQYSHAEGYGNAASGNSSHAEGYQNTASNYYTHAEGYQNAASGSCSHVEGYKNTASGHHSHAEGSQTIANNYQHTQGKFNKDVSAAEGVDKRDGTAFIIGNGTSDTDRTNAFRVDYDGSIYIVDTANSAVDATLKLQDVLGSGDYVSKTGDIMTGMLTISSGGLVVGSTGGTALGTQAFSQGDNIVSGHYSHAQGEENTVSGQYSHAQGWSNEVSANYSYAEGERHTASGYCSHTEGFANQALNRCEHAQGQYNSTTLVNATAWSSEANAMTIGNGTSSARSNSFRVTNDGKVYGLSAFNSSGADYAEYFEWLDGNPKGDDRVGRFVTLDGDKIRLATAGDDYIVGVVSGTPSIIGNAQDDIWKGMWKRDEWGRLLFEEVEVEAVARDIEHPQEVDADGNVTKEAWTETIEISPAGTETRLMLNPDYDTGQIYTPRSKRSEWAAIGMLGQIKVLHDGTLTSNSYCMSGTDGIATTSETGYRVLSVNDSVATILFR